MRIRFGPEHDHRHVDPAAPGAYEWWYFDAISDEGRYAFVVIYFLGSPMSPYYKAVVDGKRPRASDWCGVFVSLHERQNNRWTERAYAYNLYSDGSFASEHSAVAIGASRMEGEAVADGSHLWRLGVQERGLWRGTVQANLTFTAPTQPSIPDLSTVSADDGHTWVCVAPECSVAGNLTLANGMTLAFHGNGYHDHNFGILPWNDTDIWYWARAHLVGEEGRSYTGIVYDLENTDGTAQATTLFWRDGQLWASGNGDTGARSLDGSEIQNAYGFRHRDVLRTSSEPFVCETRFQTGKGILAEGPFYRRVPVEMALRQDSRVIATGTGIGEIFRPARLCGPIAARAMWTRMRRRS